MRYLTSILYWIKGALYKDHNSREPIMNPDNDNEAIIKCIVAVHHLGPACLSNLYENRRFLQLYYISITHLHLFISALHPLTPTARKPFMLHYTRGTSPLRIFTYT